jgi:hypothetical protein
MTTATSNTNVGTILLQGLGWRENTFADLPVLSQVRALKVTQTGKIMCRRQTVFTRRSNGVVVRNERLQMYNRAGLSVYATKNISYEPGVTLERAVADYSKELARDGLLLEVRNAETV